MKIIKNEESIKRNGKVGGIVLLLCVIILVGGFYINANNMSAENPRLFYFTLASFVIGVILLQIGMATAGPMMNPGEARLLMTTSLRQSLARS